MPRVLPGLEVERWLDAEPDGRRRSAVMRWLSNLTEAGSLLALMSLPDAEPTIDLEIPGTELVATCIVSLVLDVIVVERIAPTS